MKPGARGAPAADRAPLLTSGATAQDPPPLPTSGTAAPPGSPITRPPGRASRSAQRDAAVRATLRPLDAGERPWPITLSAALTAASGVGNIVAYAAGLKIAARHPAAGGIVIFSLLMLACAVGLWRMWYGAVLAFMALLAIIVTLFALFLIEASNVLGFVIPPLVIGGCGFLFWKLVRVLSRIQMPRSPGR